MTSIPDTQLAVTEAACVSVLMWTCCIFTTTQNGTQSFLCWETLSPRERERERESAVNLEMLRKIWETPQSTPCEVDSHSCVINTAWKASRHFVSPLDMCMPFCSTKNSLAGITSTHIVFEIFVNRVWGYFLYACDVYTPCFLKASVCCPIISEEMKKHICNSTGASWHPACSTSGKHLHRWSLSLSFSKLLLFLPLSRVRVQARLIVNTARTSEPEKQPYILGEERLAFTRAYF